MPDHDPRDKKGPDDPFEEMEGLPPLESAAEFLGALENIFRREAEQPESPTQRQVLLFNVPQMIKEGIPPGTMITAEERNQVMGEMSQIIKYQRDEQVRQGVDRVIAMIEGFERERRSKAH